MESGGCRGFQSRHAQTVVMARGNQMRIQEQDALLKVALAELGPPETPGISILQAPARLRACQWRERGWPHAQGAAEAEE